MDPEKLKSALDAVVKDPSLAMRPDGTTFCNIGLSRAAKLYGYEGFLRDGEPLTARETIEKILLDKTEWIIVEGKQAADFSQRGGWAVAFMHLPQEAHDHVATVYPAPMQPSGSLGKFVPLVANVGRTCGVMKSSQAFPVDAGECKYAIRV